MKSVIVGRTFGSTNSSGKWTDFGYANFILAYNGRSIDPLYLGELRINPDGKEFRVTDPDDFKLVKCIEGSRIKGRNECLITERRHNRHLRLLSFRF